MYFIAELIVLARSLPEPQNRRVAERVFSLIKEIVEDIKNYDQEFDDSRIGELETQLGTLPIPELLDRIFSIVNIYERGSLEEYLFPPDGDAWGGMPWTPNMIEGVPPEPIPTPRQLTLFPEEQVEFEEVETAKFQGGLLDASEEMETSLPEIQPNIVSEPVALAEKRYLNAGIKDRDRNEPLVVDETYLLEFGVDIEKGTFFAARLPDNHVLFKDDETSIDLTIQLDGDGFDVVPRTQILKLPRYGASKKVNFMITPKQKGSGTLTATVHKQGNFVLEMELTFPVGTGDTNGATTSVHGRSLSAVQYLKPRELGLRLKQVENGYECIIWGAVSNQVVLRD